jgi:hypothetical protein
MSSAGGTVDPKDSAKMTRIQQAAVLGIRTKINF